MIGGQLPGSGATLFYSTPVLLAWEIVESDKSEQEIIAVRAATSSMSCDQALFVDQAADAKPVYGRGTGRDRPARVAVSAAWLRPGSGAAGADCDGSRTRAGFAADGPGSR